MARRETTSWTVGQVAERFGVTVRALHHYDRIGLLHPSERSDAGYRRYTRQDLMRLQQIVTYRRLELPLERIAELLATGDAVAQLRRQRAAVMDRLGELRQLVAAIDRALEKTMDQQQLTDEELQALFGESFTERQLEAEHRWGTTDAWRQSQQRTSSYTKADWERIKAEGQSLMQRQADAFGAGAAPTDPLAMDLVEEHREYMSRWFYDCSPQQHRWLSDLYVSDPRFVSSYDESFDAPGLARWVRDAIHANADRLEG